MCNPQPGRCLHHKKKSSKYPKNKRRVNLCHWPYFSIIFVRFMPYGLMIHSQSYG
jgi:hypothetical protein